MLEEEVVVKQNGAGCNRSYGGTEEDVVQKQDGEVNIGIRRWPQEGQPCGLLEENSGKPPVP